MFLYYCLDKIQITYIKMQELSESQITALYSNHKQKFNNFIILCDEHDSVAYQIGKHNYCLQNACLCRRKCKQQKQKHRSDNHQYISAKKFIKDLEKLKVDYSKFKDNIFKNVIPIFIQKMRLALKDIQNSILKQFKEEENLSALYFSMGIQSSDILRDLLSEKAYNWDLQKLTCKDVQSLYASFQTAKSLKYQQNPKYWQERIFKNLRSYVLDFMLQKELLPSLKTQQSRQKVSIIIDEHYFQQIKNRLQSKMKNNAIRTQLEGKIFDKLTIKVHQTIQQVCSDKQGNNFLLKNAETQSFFKSIETFVSKYRPNAILFAVKFPINRSTFWQRMHNFIAKCPFFRELQIYSSENCENDYYIRQLKLFNSIIKIKDSHNVQWDVQQQHMRKQKVKTQVSKENKRQKLNEENKQKIEAK